MISHAATAAVQVSACRPLPGVPPAKDEGIAWKKSEPAP